MLLGEDATEMNTNVSEGSATPPDQFDVFLSHSHVDAKWAENLATRLESEVGFHVWLDKWVLIPGQSWQQAMARGLNQAKACAVCIGENTPLGWFREEIERALNRQAKDHPFGSFQCFCLMQKP